MDGDPVSILPERSAVQTLDGERAINTAIRQIAAITLTIAVIAKQQFCVGVLWVCRNECTVPLKPEFF